MKTLKSTLMCAVVSFACSQSAICAYLVGSVDPGAPADQSDETHYVETLLGMGANSTYLEPMSGNKFRTYLTGSYDAAVVPIVDYLKYDTETPAPITGYQFVLGKFGNESWVWEISSNETFTLPSSYSDEDNKGGGLSHYSVFNKTTTRVPDGGTSIALLGMALLGLGGVRKALGKI
jgi:hypothetical protein